MSWQPAASTPCHSGPVILFPKPMDNRLLGRIAPAVARAASPAGWLACPIPTVILPACSQRDRGGLR